MTGSDKRRFKRLKSSLEAGYRIVNKHGDVLCDDTGTAINISKTGLLLQTKRYIIPETKLDITLIISDTSVHLKCQCMYCRESDINHYEAGIHILKINKKGVDRYFNLLKSLEQTIEDTHSLRPQTRELTDVVKRISAEHKIITQYVVIIENLISTHSPDLEQAVTLMRLLKTDIVTHFNIEESLFFDIAKKTLPPHFGEIISRLTYEHRVTIKDIDSLIADLEHQIENSEFSNLTVTEKIADLMLSIKNHAAFELTELFPAIENHPEAKMLIMKKLDSISQQG